MKRELITYFDPKSPVSEMFRTLRTNLQYMNAVEELKTIAITSTLPGEGKSWTSSNLAVAYAQAGKKVILIDADLRKGKQFTIFGIPPAPGLSNYLSGIIDKRKNINLNNVEEFMYETDVQNLLIMPAGNVPPNPAELLVSARMINLLEKLKEKFDIVIFDTPPTLLVTDACALSRIVDTTIIVAAYAKTKKDDLEKVKKAIENVGGKVAGVVMNQVPMSESKYEGAYYYGSSSDRRSSKDGHNTSTSRSSYAKIKDEYRSTEQSNSYIDKRFKEISNKEISQEENKFKPKEEDINRNVKENESAEKEKPKVHTPKIPQEQTRTQENVTRRKTENNKKITQDQTITIDRTQDILKQVNEYLDIEKNKLNNGGY